MDGMILNRIASVMKRMAEVSSATNNSTTGRIYLSKWNITNGSDISQALSEAIDTADGRLIVGIPGLSVVLRSPISKVGKSVRIDLSGMTITQSFNGSAIDIVGGFSSIQTISAISATKDQITVTNGSLFAAGDSIRVVSDDHATYSYSAASVPANNDYRRGEVSSVKSVNGNVVTLTHPLLDTYPTNPRVGIYRDCVGEWIGGEFRAETGHDSTDSQPWATTFLRFSAMKSVRIVDFKGRNSYGRGIKLIGNASEAVLRPDMSGFRNVPESSQYGYCIDISAGNGTIISDGRFGTNRHAVTTSTIYCEANTSNIHYHGNSRFGVINSCVGFGDSQSHFETHSGSEYFLFSNCISESGLNGSAYQLRGRGHRVIDSLCLNSKYGAYVFTETERVDPADYTTDCSIQGLDIRNCQGQAIKVISASATIRDCPNIQSQVWTALGFENASVVFEGDNTIRPGVGESASDNVIELDGTTVDNRGKITIDATSSSVGAMVTGNVVNYLTGINGWSGGELDVIVPSQVSRVVSGSALVAGSGQFEPTRITIPSTCRVGSGTLLKGCVVRGRAMSESSDITLTTGNVQLYNTSSRTQRVITTLTGTLNVKLPAQDPVVGDRFRIIRNAGGTYRLTVQDGTTVIKTMTVTGSWADFIFNGLNWVVAAEGSDTGRQYVSSRWYTPLDIGSLTTSGAAPGANSLRGFLGRIAVPVTIDGFGLRVTTAATGNSQIAIYAADAMTLAPTGAPLYSSSSMSTAATGSISVTGASLTLAPGWYWFFSCCDNATAVFASVQNVGGGAQAALGADSPSSVMSTNGISKSGTFGTWPTFTGDITSDGFSFFASSAMPVIAFKPL